MLAEGAGDEVTARRIKNELSELRRRIKRVPFLDTYDLRYNLHLKQPVPTSKAVMFCLMDVSGSMDQHIKELAKRFYLLLYLFLKRNYERTEIVFIRHHTVAKEVDEQEFFYSRETGGTVVSSALKLMTEDHRRALLAERMEHLRCAGVRRRQLERRLTAVRRRIEERHPAARAVFLVRRNHAPRPAGAVERVSEAGRLDARTLRSAPHCRR